MPDLGFCLLGDPEAWGDDPEGFRPERFLHPETGRFANPSPESYVPFSVGKR